jgi:hypothetical protein
MGHYLTYVLVPNGTDDVETKVAEMMAPYWEEYGMPSHERECRCVFDNAVKEGSEDLKEQYPNLGPHFFEFTKEEFRDKALSENQMRRLLQLGVPDPDCEECGGTGFYMSKDHPEPKWDECSIGQGFAEGILKDCIKSSPENPNIVPVRDLDLQKLPKPDHILNPEGIWFSEERFLWSKPVMVIDENWTETVRTLLENHEDSTLVVLNVHL